MKVNTRQFALMVFLIYWGLIVVAMATGLWDNTAATKTGIGILPPEEIHGTMTVQELLDTYALDKEIFYTVFKLPASTPTTLRLRDIAHKNGFEVEEIRNYVKENLTTTQQGTIDACQDCQDRSACPEEQKYNTSAILKGTPSGVPFLYPLNPIFTYLLSFIALTPNVHFLSFFNEIFSKLRMSN